MVQTNNDGRNCSRNSGSALQRTPRAPTALGEFKPGSYGSRGKQVDIKFSKKDVRR